jgi:hypothetical protein
LETYTLVINNKNVRRKKFNMLACLNRLWFAKTLGEERWRLNQFTRIAKLV